MIPMSIVGVFEHSGLLHQFWQGVAWTASAVAMWAHTRAHKGGAIDPVDDLMDRLRRPVRWTMRHPVIAVRRKLDRRRSD